METMINLTDLLKHEILDLYSVEEQIIEAMPSLIEKSKNPELKKTLREHLKITEEQKNRLDKIKQIFGEEPAQGDGEKKGFFSRLFGGSSGGEKCKGMEGIISEGQKIINADISEGALDAAVIASAQKIEHYEICGYGTARAYARELKLTEVESLLTQTLNEEYQADDLLTRLAVGRLNLEADKANDVVSIDGKRESSKATNGAGNRTGAGNFASGKGSSKQKNKGSQASSSKGSLKNAIAADGKAPAGKSISSGSGSKRTSKSGASTSKPGGKSTGRPGAPKATAKGTSKSASKSSNRYSVSAKGGSKKATSKKSLKQSSAKGSKKR